METIITLIVLAIVIIAILYVISIWVYKRAPANVGFIRTGFLGTKVSLGKGAIVLPVFHEVTWVSLETLKLVVSRAREQAVLTSDKIRVDVVAELYTHVGHTTGDLLTAARSLGERTFDAERVRNLLEAKVVSALRSYAATKTLDELHENRDAFAREIRANVTESFSANGLVLEEVTIVALEQSGREFFKTDNVFDAEGLKIITEITSNARRTVHNTEKRTTVAIRQRDLDAQLELFEIERQEAFARAQQDKEIANEQALQVGQKQIYVLDQRMAVETKEIDNEKDLERMRTERDLAVIEEARRREAADIGKDLAIERNRRDRDIALIEKASEQELADVKRNLALEKAQKDREIELIEKAREEEIAEIARGLSRESAEKDRDIQLASKERERQRADIERITAVTEAEEAARTLRHKAQEDASLAVRAQSLETRLAMLDLDKREAFAAAQQDQEVSDEQTRILSAKQRFILEQRLEVEREEIRTAKEVEQAEIAKSIVLLEDTERRESAEIRRTLAREREEREREIALAAKGEELDRAEVQRRRLREQEERDREIALVTKEEELDRARVQRARAVEIEEREREIAVIEKEGDRERADIRRFLAREQEERDREIAIAAKTRELEVAESERLQATAERRRAQSHADSVPLVSAAERQKEIDRIQAEAGAQSREIGEETKARITRMHMVTQSEARREASAQEAEATLARARAASEAQQIQAVGIEREAGARGRAEMEIESLRVVNTERRFEAEARGLETKAGALKMYNEAATFLELAKMHIEAERDVHIDQARAMGGALAQAQIRMYGGGADGTMDTIRGLFTSGFGLGEILEGVAQGMPEGLRDRLARNGVRGLFGRPNEPLAFRQGVERLEALAAAAIGDDRSLPLAEALEKLTAEAGDDAAARAAVGVLSSLNQQGYFDDVPFETVWSLVQATAHAIDER